MVDVVTALLAISLILFFGFIAEFIFRKFNVPDVLFLIVLGFVIGPFVLNYVQPESFAGAAPIFTTFTLLFLLFDGAFNINLVSLIKEFSRSFVLTIFNFAISAIAVTAVLWLLGFPLLVSLLAGFLLGGISSSFVIPILKQMKISPNTYSLLTLEGALTDVFTIVFSLTVMELIRLGEFGVQDTLTQLASLFAVAGLIGIIGGVIWIALTVKVFKEHNYMLTVAYLILLYVVAEFLNGNGAIAALFFGLMLKNSKQLTSIMKGIVTRNAREKKKALKGALGEAATTRSEEYFYHQVSFLLKTFFFVYIGILLDISDRKALLLGGGIAVLLMLTRLGSTVLTKGMEESSRLLVNSMFARGLAAAVIAQLAVQAGVPHAAFLVKVSYVAIAGTILLSSVKVFLVKRKLQAAVAE